MATQPPPCSGPSSGPLDGMSHSVHLGGNSSNAVGSLDLIPKYWVKNDINLVVEILP